MFRNKSVDVHQFAMVPRAEVPRSRFRMQKTLKSTFDSGYLVPVFCEEVLPGDSFSLRMTAFARLSTPLFPIMDNLYLDSFFFYVPNRLLWDNWKKFMGEQVSPGDSISFSIPQVTAPASGFTVGSLCDYFGLPTVGQVGGGNVITGVSALPIRAYHFIYNEWFRDQNLVSSISGISAAGGVGVHPRTDGPDALNNVGSGAMLKRGKRHDYFTGCLPFVQKGTAVGIPLGTSATVRTSATPLVSGAQTAAFWRTATAGGDPTGAFALRNYFAANATTIGESATSANTGSAPGQYPSNLYADLSTATTATINALRLAFQTQKLLERDARGGTRYTEIVRSHFGVISPDARLQRPEYLGGGSAPISINPVAQTSQSGLTGGTTVKGSLSAFGTMVAQGHGFSQSFTEHGYIIGLVSVRADLTYQQGLRKHWQRLTRYDFYFPVFAALGEQAVLNKEIYCDGSANDALVFGYQERWAEYRYMPSEITGLFRSTSAGTLDPWHVAQKFTALPTLNSTFIGEAPPIDRIIAVASVNSQFLFDAFFDITAARPMPMYSVPGLIDHF